MQQPPHPKQPLPPVPAIATTTAAAPLLLLHNQDREYYSDVAQSLAAADQRQSQFQPATGQFGPTIFPAAALSFDQMTEYDEENYAVPADQSSQYRLDRTQVELVQLIGEGQKGYVFLGKVQSKDGRQIHDVAIKTLKYETPQLIDWLMREAAMMRQLEHPHIIKFIGVCPESPALIAMELAQLGELRHFLGANQSAMPISQLVLFTFQISTALSYLESKQFVHRDVAARNILVCAHNCVKLADFGLTRNLQTAAGPTDFDHEDPMPMAAGGGHYVAAARGKLPVRWLAPESLAFRRFTSASDVWMFAVCGWEMFHFGQARPWAQIRNNQVLLAIESGQRLARPPNCPSRLYELLLQCWSYAPVQRPKFRELKQNLWSIYLNERAKEQLELEQQQQQHRILLQQQQQQQQARAKKQSSNRLQQQHQRLAALDDRLTTPRVSVRPRPHQELLALGVSSPLNLSYGSNVSGYSSATAADFSSHNSSRSSSMGSLARRQQRQQQQLACSSGGLWAPSEPQPQPQPQPRRTSPVAAAAARQPMAASRNLEFESNVEQNMRRFQRPAGHMLQKQRSQGSIVQPAAPYSSPDHRSFGPKSNLYSAGFDDGALLANSSAAAAAAQVRYYQQQRPLSHQSGGPKFATPEAATEEEEEEDESDLDADEDEDYGADSSDEQMAAARRHQTRPDRRRLLQLPSRRCDGPTYEGLMVAGGGGDATASVGQEVAMIRGDLGAIQRRQRSRAAGTRGGGPSDSMKREQKLSDVLQSLRLSPMKARLSANGGGGGSGRSSGSPAPSQSSPVELSRQRHHKHSPPKSPKLPPDLASEHKDSEQQQQRQLALHQRLLGHIRPPSGSIPSRFSEHRRSMNMEQQQPNFIDDLNQQQQQQTGGSSVEKVDQSLQILESLISEKTFAPNQQQQQHSATDLVQRHRQQMKQQLQQSSADKRSNPAQQFVDFFVRRKQQQQQQ